MNMRPTGPGWITRRWFAWLGALVVGGALSGAGEADPLKRGFDPTTPGVPASMLYRQRVYRRGDGLPSDVIRALRIGKDRTLWVGTAAGLVRHVGGRFQVFDHVTHPELRSDTVRALDEGPDGALWVGTEGGLVEFRDGRVHRRYTTAEGLADDRVPVLLVRRNGEVWFGTMTALHRLRDGVVTNWAGRLGVHEDKGCVSDLIEDSGVLLGSLTLTPTRWAGNPTLELGFFPVYAGEGFRLVGCTGIARDARNRLWFGFSPSVIREPEGTWKRVPRGDPLESIQGRLMLWDRSETLWLNDWDDGLLAYREGRVRRYGVADGLSATPVHAMVEDHEGNLWIGTESGLNCWQPRALPNLGMREGLPDDNAWAVTEGSDGEVWIGTDGGVARHRAGAPVDRPVVGLMNNKVRTLHVDREGTLWIGTGDSLESWRDGALVVHRWENGETMNKVRVVTSDRAGRIWVGRERGLMCLEDGHWRQFTTADGLPRNDVRAVREDRAGRLWVGTFGGGLAVVEAKGPPKTWPFSVLARYGTTNGMASDFVWAFHEERDGTMWAGTERGLTRFRGGDVPRPAGTVGRAQGLHYESINEVLEDDRGWFWLGTDRGIARVPAEELHEAATTGSRVRNCRVTLEADGLASDETNGQKSQPAGWKTRDGRVWFPTTRGVAVLDPATMDVREVPAAVVIERVVVDGTTWFENGPGAAPGSGRELRLGPGRGKVLEIGFDAVTYRVPRGVRFRHRLTGFDPDWVETGDRGLAFYTNLEPGRYRFEVEAAVNHTHWSPVPASLLLVLEPRLHQTPAFRLAVVAAAVASAWGWMRWRERERERLADLRRQIDVERERQRIARDMHDELGAGLTRLVLLGNQGRRGSASEAETPPLWDRIGGEAARLVDQLGEMVWATNPEFDDLPSLLGRLREHAAGLLADAELAAVLEFPDPAAMVGRRITGVVRKNLSLAFKEAMTNTVRHAGASAVEVRCRVDAGSLEIEISDDGRGFDPKGSPRRGTGGNGLKNLRARLERVGGDCQVTSEAGRGTRVRLRVPCAEAG